MAPPGMHGYPGYHHPPHSQPPHGHRRGGFGPHAWSEMVGAYPEMTPNGMEESYDSMFTESVILPESEHPSNIFDVKILNNLRSVWKFAFKDQETMSAKFLKRYFEGNPEVRQLLVPTSKDEKDDSDFVKAGVKLFRSTTMIVLALGNHVFSDLVLADVVDYYKEKKLNDSQIMALFNELVFFLLQNDNLSGKSWNALSVLVSYLNQSMPNFFSSDDGDDKEEVESKGFGGDRRKEKKPRKKSGKDSKSSKKDDNDDKDKPKKFDEDDPDDRKPGKKSGKGSKSENEDDSGKSDEEEENKKKPKKQGDNDNDDEVKPKRR